MKEDDFRRRSRVVGIEVVQQVLIEMMMEEDLGGSGAGVSGMKVQVWGPSDALCRQVIWGNRDPDSAIR